MKKLLLISAMAAASTASFAGNIQESAGTMLAPQATGTYEIYSAKQFIGPEECTYNVYRIRGEITGLNDDTGLGFDEVTFDVWDDGFLRDRETVSVRVGQTVEYNITLEFEGVFGTGVAGVGLSAPEVGLNLDPYYPEDVAVDNCTQALKCWVTPTVAEAGDEVTVHAELVLNEPGTTMTAYSATLVPFTQLDDADADGVYEGSFTVPAYIHRGVHLFPVRAVTPAEEVFWCPGFRKLPNDLSQPTPQSEALEPTLGARR